MDLDNIDKAFMALFGLTLNKTIAQRFLLPTSEFSNLDDFEELDNIITDENANAFYHVIDGIQETDFGREFYRPLMRTVIKKWSNKQYTPFKKEAAEYCRSQLLNNKTDDANTIIVEFLGVVGGDAFGAAPPPRKLKPLFDSIRGVLLPRDASLLASFDIGEPSVMTIVGEMLERAAWAGFNTGFYFSFLPLIYTYWFDNQLSFSDDPVAGAVWAMLFLSGAVAADLIVERKDEPAFRGLLHLMLFIMMVQFSLSYFGPFVEQDILNMSAPIMKWWIMPFGYLITKVLQTFPVGYRAEPGFIVEILSFAMFIGTRSSEDRILVGELVVASTVSIAMASMTYGATKGIMGLIKDLISSRQAPQQYIDGDMGFLKQLFVLPDFPDHDPGQSRTIITNVKAARKPIRKLLALLLLQHASQMLIKGGVFSPNAGCEPPLVVEIVKMLDEPSPAGEPQRVYLERVWESVKHHSDLQGGLTPDLLIKNMVANPYCRRVLYTLQKERPQSWQSLIALGGKSKNISDKRPQVLELYATVALSQSRRLRDKAEEKYIQDAKEQLQRMIDDVTSAFKQSQNASSVTADINPVLISSLLIYTIGAILAIGTRPFLNISYVNVEKMGLRNENTKKLIRHCDTFDGSFEECLLTDTGKQGNSMLEAFFYGPGFNPSEYKHGVKVRRPSQTDILAMMSLQQGLNLTTPTVAQRLAPISYTITALAPEYWSEKSDVMVRVNRREIDLSFTVLDDGTLDWMYNEIKSNLKLALGLFKTGFWTNLARVSPELIVNLFKNDELPSWQQWQNLVGILLGIATGSAAGVAWWTGMITLKPLFRLLEAISPSRIWAYIWAKYRRFVEMWQWVLLPALSEASGTGSDRQFRQMNEKTRVGQKEWRFAFAFAEMALMQEIGAPALMPFHDFGLQGAGYTAFYVAFMFVFWDNVYKTGNEYFKIHPFSLDDLRVLIPATTTATTAPATLPTVPVGGRRVFTIPKGGLQLEANMRL
jgi:hypothetical protein